MKLNPAQIQKLSEKILQQWQQSSMVHFKVDQKQVLERIIATIQKNIHQEIELDREVNAMLDKLEQTNSGEFQRFKMFPILKNKIAKDRKVVL